MIMRSYQQLKNSLEHLEEFPLVQLPGARGLVLPALRQALEDLGRASLCGVQVLPQQDPDAEQARGPCSESPRKLAVPAPPLVSEGLSMVYGSTSKHCTMSYHDHHGYDEQRGFDDYQDGFHDRLAASWPEKREQLQEQQVHLNKGLNKLRQTEEDVHGGALGHREGSKGRTYLTPFHCTQISVHPYRAKVGSLDVRQCVGS